MFHRKGIGNKHVHTWHSATVLNCWRWLCKVNVCPSNTSVHAGHSPICQPEGNTGQNLRQQEEIQALVMQLRHIGDSVNYRMIQEVRTSRGLPGWGGKRCPGMIGINGIYSPNTRPAVYDPGAKPAVGFSKMVALRQGSLISMVEVNKVVDLG